MNIFDIFKNNPSKSEIEKKALAETPQKLQTYTVGWQIRVKDGRDTCRTYNVDSEEKRKEARKTVNESVEAMYKILETAVREGKTFVNLESNVFRMEDIKDIVVTDKADQKSNDDSY